MKARAFEKSYHGRCVLKTEPLEFEHGRLYAVIGANGSGKSTFAKVLANIEAADDALAALSGVRVGYMPQKSYAFRMSVKANILLGGNNSTKAAELMRSLHITELADKPAHKLSGGETARMALARLMMKEHELLIFDEPTASMDMESTALTEDLLRQYCKETACAILLITHSLQQARRVADEAFFFHKGRIIESGSTSRILYTPNEEETKEFLRFYGDIT